MRTSSQIEGLRVQFHAKHNTCTVNQLTYDLTVWDLGRVAIGLLNLKYFTPTVELLDESIRVMAENQDTRTTSPIKQQGVKFFVHPSPLIIPAIINENIRIEDLLDIKLTAMKEVSLITKRFQH